MDPFATLGLAPSFDVDLPAVERTHRELSRALHPDRYVGATSSERRAALERAVAVNEAWRVMRDPIRRAEALLRLRGVETAEQDEPKASPEFLMEMMEQRELLSDARRGRDLATVKSVAAGIEVRSQAVLAELSAGFAHGDAAELRARVGELRFYRRLLDEVSAIEDELAVPALAGQAPALAK
jgi:molecular chaperone HscB